MKTDRALNKSVSGESQRDPPSSWASLTDSTVKNLPVLGVNVAQLVEFLLSAHGILVPTQCKDSA